MKCPTCNLRLGAPSQSNTSAQPVEIQQTQTQDVGESRKASIGGVPARFGLVATPGVPTGTPAPDTVLGAPNGELTSDEWDTMSREERVRYARAFLKDALQCEHDGPEFSDRVRRALRVAGAIAEPLPTAGYDD